jgi:hypothetical protein
VAEKRYNYQRITIGYLDEILNHINNIEDLLSNNYTISKKSLAILLLEGDEDSLKIIEKGTELEFVIMVIAVSCVKLLSAHNSTQHTSRKHKV